MPVPARSLPKGSRLRSEDVRRLIVEGDSQVKVHHRRHLIPNGSPQW